MSQGFTIDPASPSACIALFWGTFVQEGLALASGALLIGNGDAPALWVGISLLAGMVCGDCCVYGLGAFARTRRWAQRLIADVNLPSARGWLANNILLTVGTCHIVPWLLFPTFVAYGWYKVPFERFAMTSIGFNAIYVPLALFALARLGIALPPYFVTRPWLAWLLLATIFTVLTALHLRMRRLQD